MALTKIPIELSSTPSIVDGGNATAITIDSNENVTLGVPNSVNLSGATTELTLGDTGNTDNDGFGISFVHNTTELNAYVLGQKSAMTLGTAGATPLNIVTNNSARMVIDSSGRVTMPSQPAFSVTTTSTQGNIAINSDVTVVLGTETFDVGANFASNTFTAPVTGKYQLNVHVRLDSIDTAAAYYYLKIKTSNRIYYSIIDPGGLSSDPLYWSLTNSALADMDASDTAYVSVYQAGGTSQTDIQADTNFSGYLVA